MAGVREIRRAMLLDSCTALSELAAELRQAAVTDELEQAAEIVRRFGVEVMLAAETLAVLTRPEPFQRL